MLVCKVRTLFYDFAAKILHICPQSAYKYEKNAKNIAFPHGLAMHANKKMFYISLHVTKSVIWRPHKVYPKL